MGRTVYGGGGIMPDIFVPIDTSRYTTYHRNLVAKGVVNKFILNYMENKRNSLLKDYPKDKKRSFKDFDEKFEISDDMLNELIVMGEKENVKHNEEEYNKSKELLKLQLKAIIARDLWDMNEYYQIMNKIDDSYLKALEILQKPEMYNKSLRR